MRASCGNPRFRSRAGSRLALSLAGLWLATPAFAIDCVMEAVNRTGKPQVGQRVLLAGWEIFTEVRARGAGQDLVRNTRPDPAGFSFEADTLLDFALRLDPKGLQPVIPSTDREIYLPPPNDSLARIEFSVADHEFELLDWSWIDGAGKPLTVPALEGKVTGNLQSGVCTLQFINTSATRTVTAYNPVFSCSFSRGPLSSLVTNPRSPSALEFLGEEIVLDMPEDFTLARRGTPGDRVTLEVTLAVNGKQLPLTPDLQLFFRAEVSGPEGGATADFRPQRPTSRLIVRDQPFRNYAPLLTATVYPYQDLGRSVRVLVLVEARDPDTDADATNTFPTVVLEDSDTRVFLTPNLPAPPNPQDVFEPPTVEQTKDRRGRKIRRYSVSANFQKVGGKGRVVLYRFRATDKDGQISTRDVQFELP